LRDSPVVDIGAFIEVDTIHLPGDSLKIGRASTAQVSS
jgi:hypothetical protein